MLVAPPSSSSRGNLVCTATAAHRLRPANRLGGSGGFTLIEALAAFVVLAILTVIIQRGVVVVGASLLRADGWIEAELIARTLLATPTSELGSMIGSRTGRTNGRDWMLRLEPLPLPTAAKGTEQRAPAAVAWAPMRMTIRVSILGAQTLNVETVRLVQVKSP